MNTIILSSVSLGPKSTILEAVQTPFGEASEPIEGWVLTTGIWNNNEFWDDNGIWKD